jgi:hypothetical protein
MQRRPVAQDRGACPGIVDGLRGLERASHQRQSFAGLSCQPQGKGALRHAEEERSLTSWGSLLLRRAKDPE